VRAAQQLAQRGAGDEGLQAAAVAAAADRALGIDQDMADLPRDAAGTAKGATVDHQSRADARRQAQVGHDVRAAAHSECRLAERADVGVVVEVDGELEALLHLAGGVQAHPAGQDRLRVHEAARAVDRAGQAHAGGEDAVALDAGLVDELVNQARGGVERVLGGRVDLELRVGLGEDRVGEVGDGDPEAVVSEVQADHGAGRLVEGDEHRRAATLRAGRRGGLGDALDDQAGGL
jgi:hypothetical protein